MIFANKKVNAFTLLEVIIVLVVITISLPSLMFSINNIENQNIAYNKSEEVLKELKKFVYTSQAKGKILGNNDIIKVNKVEKIGCILLYKCSFNDGFEEYEFEFSVEEK